MCGAAAASLVGRPYADLIAEESAWIGRSSFSRVLMGETVTESLRMRRADGGTFPVTASSAPVRVGDRIVGVVTTAKDMSAFAEATASLEASEERFRSLFDYSPDAMLALDRSTAPSRARTPPPRAITGYTIEELIGLRGVDLLLPAHARAATEVFRRGDARPRGSIEVDALRGDGTTCPCSRR